MSHTPGPWKVIAPIRGYAAGVATQTEGEVPQNEIAVADIPETQGRGDAQANARLIAVSPELLAMVRAYATTYPLDAYADKAAQLIAKAEGLV